VTTQALVGELHACLAFGIFRGCARGSLGGLRVGSEGLPRFQAQVVLLATVGARVAVDWRFSSHIGLRGFLDFDAHLARTTITSDSLPVWRMPPVMGALGVAVLVATGN
jgi:hypothetical protein